MESPKTHLMVFVDVRDELEVEIRLDIQ